MGLNLAIILGAMFMEVSAKNGDNINELFKSLELKLLEAREISEN